MHALTTSIEPVPFVTPVPVRYAFDATYPPAARQWGNWHYEDHGILALHDDAGRFLYELDLDRCNTPAGMLNSIMWIAALDPDDAILADMLRAFEELLGGRGTCFCDWLYMGAGKCEAAKTAAYRVSPGASDQYG